MPPCNALRPSVDVVANVIVGLLFWLLALGSCAVATWLGGRDGRIAAALIVSASLLTIGASQVGSQWQQVEVARLCVDAALLIGLYLLMLNCRRWWPVWMTGFHLVAVTSHLGVALAPDHLPTIYRGLESFWAIPVLLSLLFGVVMDAHHGVDQP